MTLCLDTAPPPAPPARAVRRVETILDLEDALALGPEFYAEAGLPGRFHQGTAVRTWAQLIKAGTGMVAVLGEPGCVVGAVGGLLYPDLNDGALVAAEAFWFVSPGARGRGALALLDEYEAWAREAGAARLSMVHLVSLNADRLARLYARRGYRPVEVHYIKEI
jgi:GNAT superfamily N-acetyltransferase